MARSTESPHSLSLVFSELSIDKRPFIIPAIILVVVGIITSLTNISTETTLPLTLAAASVLISEGWIVGAIVLFEELYYIKEYGKRLPDNWSAEPYVRSSLAILLLWYFFTVKSAISPLFLRALQVIALLILAMVGVVLHSKPSSIGDWLSISNLLFSFAFVIFSVLVMMFNLYDLNVTQWLLVIIPFFLLFITAIVYQQRGYTPQS